MIFKFGIGKWDHKKKASVNRNLQTPYLKY